MVPELMNKLSKISSKHKWKILVILCLTLISLSLFRLYEEHFTYYITVKFSESGPLYKNMPVCYKGYRIGHTQKVTLSEDYKYTYVKIVLYPKNPKLPKDIIGAVKKHDILINYIDLISPESPSTALLKNGDIIEGKPIFDMSSFLSDIADSKLIIPLIQTFSDTLVSANKTSTEIKNFFSDSRLILKDNRQNLKQTTKDLALSTKSLAKITSRVNSTITEDKLNNTTSSVNKSATNIQTATESVKNITASIDCATKNLDKTISKIDCTISEVNTIASNVKVITSGFCETLGKRFAGLRIIFGKPINNSKCPKNCSK